MGSGSCWVPLRFPRVIYKKEVSACSSIILSMNKWKYRGIWHVRSKGVETAVTIAIFLQYIPIVVLDWTSIVSCQSSLQQCCQLNPSPSGALFRELWDWTSIHELCLWQDTACLCTKLYQLCGNCHGYPVEEDNWKYDNSENLWGFVFYFLTEWDHVVATLETCIWELRDLNALRFLRVGELIFLIRIILCQTKT